MPLQRRPRFLKLSLTPCRSSTTTIHASVTLPAGGSQMLETWFGTIDDQFRGKCRLNSLPRCGMLRVFHVEHCWREVGKLFNQSCALRLFAVAIREFSHISPPDVTNGSDSKGNDRVRPTRYQSRFVLTNMVPGRTSCFRGRQLSEKHAQCANNQDFGNRVPLLHPHRRDPEA